MMNRFVPYEQTNKVMKTPDSFDGQIISGGSCSGDVSLKMQCEV